MMGVRGTCQFGGQPARPKARPALRRPAPLEGWAVARDLRGKGRRGSRLGDRRGLRQRRRCLRHATGSGRADAGAGARLAWVRGWVRIRAAIQPAAAQPPPRQRHRPAASPAQSMRGRRVGSALSGGAGLTAGRLPSPAPARPSRPPPAPAAALRPPGTKQLRPRAGGYPVGTLQLRGQHGPAGQDLHQTERAPGVPGQGQDRVRAYPVAGLSGG